MQSVTSNAVAKAFSYSTTEHFTGKYWIDGKPIYGIVIESPTKGTTLLTGVEEIVDYRLKRTYDNSSSNASNFEYYDGTTSSNTIYLSLANGNLQIKGVSSGNNAVMKWLYVEYTKTTD